MHVHVFMFPLRSATRECPRALQVCGHSRGRLARLHVGGAAAGHGAHCCTHLERERQAEAGGHTCAYIHTSEHTTDNQYHNTTTSIIRAGNTRTNIRNLHLHLYRQCTCIHRQDVRYICWNDAFSFSYSACSSSIAGT